MSSDKWVTTLRRRESNIGSSILISPFISGAPRQCARWTRPNLQCTAVRSAIKGNCEREYCHFVRRYSSTQAWLIMNGKKIERLLFYVFMSIIRIRANLTHKERRERKNHFLDEKMAWIQSSNQRTRVNSRRVHIISLRCVPSQLCCRLMFRTASVWIESDFVVRDSFDKECI